MFWAMMRIVGGFGFGFCGAGLLRGQEPTWVLVSGMALSVVLLAGAFYSLFRKRP